MGAAADGAKPRTARNAQVCRTLPIFMEMYKLEELTTVSKLRSNIGDKFRNNAGVQNEDAVKLLIHKGREELDLVAKMHKQRHHVITSYIVEHNPFAADQGTFLSNFYASN